MKRLHLSIFKKLHLKYNKMKEAKSTTIPLLVILIIISSCTYKKGEIYTTDLTGDSLHFVLMDKGAGTKIARKAARLKMSNEVRGNNCIIHYVTDSTRLMEEKGILFFSASMPNIDEDILTKGYFGAFTSKQDIIILLVSYEDLDQNFKRIK